MAIDNTAKPSVGTFNNTAKAFTTETWATITTTWASETRTWLATISLMQNTTKVSPSMNNTPRVS